MQPGLGVFVEYRDRNGRTKPALVVATSATIDGTDPDTGIAAPDPGSAHLTVFSFTGSQYTKHNVPAGDGLSSFTAPEGLELVFYSTAEQESAENEAAAGLV
jgi:hypothetical protein